MTLIVGIKYKGGVTLAADSQISYGHSSQRTDTQKIEEVKFADMSVLVALAEHVGNARRFIDIFREQSRNLTVSNADEVGRIAQQAMRTLRNEIREVHANCGAEELAKIISEQALNCSMMIAAYIGNEPHLIKIDLATCIYAKSRAKYETDGCGAALADYILKEFCGPDAGYDVNLILATFAVWQVTQHDRYCRGPIVVGVVARPGGLGKQRHSRCWMLSREAIENLVEIAGELDRATKATRESMIQAELSAQAEAVAKWIEKEQRELPELTEKELKEMSGEHSDNPGDS